MTAEEKAAFDALKAQVDKLQARQQMEVPLWAKAAVDAALAYDTKNPLFSIDNGASYDFTVLLRLCIAEVCLRSELTA